MLAFYATSRRLYGFLMGNQRCTLWSINAQSPNSQASLLGQINTALRDMGQRGPNSKLPVKELTDVKWKRSSSQLLNRLLQGSQADFSHPFEELAIVPDGALWYVPFEALQVTRDRETAAADRAGPCSLRADGRAGRSRRVASAIPAAAPW